MSVITPFLMSMRKKSLSFVTAIPSFWLQILATNKSASLFEKRNKNKWKTMYWYKRPSYEHFSLKTYPSKIWNYLKRIFFAEIKNQKFSRNKIKSQSWICFYCRYFFSYWQISLLSIQKVIELNISSQPKVLRKGQINIESSNFAKTNPQKIS